MSRRLILVMIMLGAVAGCRAPSGATATSPFRVLYNSDLTHIRTCISPYYKSGEEFNIEMLKASIDEAADAGCDAHMLAPLFTYVPAWKSEIYPIEEHVEWLKSRFPGIKISDYLKCLADGTDIVGVYVDRCKKKGIAPFISVRINDWHTREWVGCPSDTKLNWYPPNGLDKWRSTHPEYWVASAEERAAVESLLTDDRKADFRRHSELAGILRDQRALNWRYDAVRDRMFGFIREICEGYDIAGLELDFMRHYRLFDDAMPADERRRIVLDFTRRVRTLLDETSPEGVHRWLSIRAPVYLSSLTPLGLDYPAMADAGVDIFNLSANYYTVQQSDYAAIKKMLPKSAAVYVEMTQTTSKDQDIIRRGAEDKGYSFRYTTPHQFWTTAHLAYSRGLSGVSLFNFQYYREYGDLRRGPFQEPPFEAIEKMNHPDQLATEGLHYFIGQSRNSYLPGYAPLLPKILSEGETATLIMDIAPPERPLEEFCRLRLQFKYPLADQQIEVRFNKKVVEPIEDISEPFGMYNPVLTGDQTTLRAFRIPSRLVLDGYSTLEVTLLSGDVVHLNYVDLEIK